jgi:hypothetical protein
MHKWEERSTSSGVSQFLRVGAALALVGQRLRRAAGAATRAREQ